MSAFQKKTDSLNVDSIARIDSLKWLYYAMNYYGVALFRDTSSWQQIAIPPVECDIRLQNIRPAADDTLVYFFSFVNGKYRFDYVDKCINVVGFKVKGDYFHPLANHVIYDYEKNPDSVRIVVKQADEQFRKYLRNYFGRMGEWLRKEVMKRNVVQE